LVNLTYRNLELVGPPQFGEEEQEFGREIQRNLGLKPIDKPLDDTLITPEEYEKKLRNLLPPFVSNWGSDDAVEFSWHAPTSKTYVETYIKPYQGVVYPRWVRFAVNGVSITHKATFCAAKTIATSMMELIQNPDELAKCRKEFEERTGGGVGGSKWIAPLLPKDLDPPIELRWPEWIDNRYPKEPHVNLKWHIPY